MLKKLPLLIALYLSMHCLKAQADTLLFPVNTHIISYDAGLAFTSNVDKHFSDSKYEATQLVHSLSWSRFGKSGLFRMDVDYSQTSKLDFEDSHSDLLQFSLILDYLFHVSDFNLLNRNSHIYFGPILDAYYYKREQNFQLFDNLMLFHTDMSVLSTGLKVYLALNLSDKFLLDLSGAVHTGNMFVKSGENNDATFVSFTDFSRINTSVQFRYKIAQKIMFSAGYKFRYLHNKKSDEIKIASDSFNISLSLIL